VRLSTAFFNNDEDVDRAVAAVRQLIATGSGRPADA
jgi:selenocysteine lyase/cysteine desulfurase